MSNENMPVKKMCIICARGALEDVYAALVMANGAVMEGIEVRLFFTFFGLAGIQKKTMDHLHTATLGNPALTMPGNIPMPSLLGMLPGIEGAVSTMMRKQMDELDMPPVSEFLEMVSAGGGEIYACKLAMDMFKLTKEDLSDEVLDVLTIGQFYEKAAGEGTHMVFI